jgi:LEA14-like dessication related protein
MHNISKTILLLFLGLLTACANMPTSLDQAKPEVSVADFKQISAEKYRIKLRLKNPNPVPIPVTGLNYKLQINDKEFAEGESKESITIPASGEEFLEIDVASNLKSFLGGGLDGITSLLKRQVNYKLSGNLSLSDSDSVPQVPFEQKGEISLNLK